MYIHQEILKMILPLLEKYELEPVELIGEINHAAWELSALNARGIKKLIEELNAPLDAPVVIEEAEEIDE